MATIAEALALALQHHRTGNLPQAEQLYRLVLQTEPANAEALHGLGVLAYQVGRHDLAQRYIGQAVALNPYEASFHSNLGLVHQALRQWDEAVACYRQALRLRPDFPEALSNLGNVLKDQGQLDEAVACYRRAVSFRPDYAEAHSNLGYALQEQDKLDEAVASYRQALRLRPDFPEVHNNLGIALQKKGHVDEAASCYLQALHLRPDYHEAHSNLGVARKDQGRLDEAVACYRQALHFRPDYVEALSNLGNVLRLQGRRDEAVACYRQALHVRPNFTDAYGNLGVALKDQGELDEAIAAFRRVLELSPHSAITHSNLVYTLHFHPDSDAARLAEEHRHWNERHAKPLTRSIRPHGNDPDPNRRLRVGYLSPNLYCHPVGRFLLPLLEAHDHRRFEVFCYASVADPDDVTQQIRRHVDQWREMAYLSDERLAELIRGDRIDILVDLVAHMAENRSLVFARKPAPVQVSYLAYCSTTGLSAIDYRLTDPFLDPPGQPEAGYSEESVWLPETYWCYRPEQDPAPVSPLPALAAGHVTFGCLNNFCKVTGPSLKAWRGLLQAVAGARLLLHAHPGSHCDRVRAYFAAGGVDPGRIGFAGFTRLPDYLRLYEGIDIGLDPFPYAGGTTSCDALWMGVPVVSLAGELAIARAGLSILSNVGLPELVARTPEEYVDIAAALAGDLLRLAALRAELPGRLRQSPLLDAPRFARHVEAAYRAMWRRWCGR